MLKVTEIEAQKEKGTVLRSTENCDIVGHAVVIGKSKEGESEQYWVEVARPKTFAGIFEAQAFHSDEEIKLTDTQGKAVEVLSKAFSVKGKNGETETAPVLRSIMQAFYDDLKLAISANVRSKYAEGVTDTLKPFADAFNAVLSVSPKLAAKPFAEQYKAINAIRVAQGDDPLPAEAELLAKIQDLAKKKAERKAKKN